MLTTVEFCALGSFHIRIDRCPRIGVTQNNTLGVRRLYCLLTKQVHSDLVICRVLSNKNRSSKDKKCYCALGISHRTPTVRDEDSELRRGHENPYVGKHPGKWEDRKVEYSDL